MFGFFKKKDNTEKEIFFEKYKDCAKAAVLKEIWTAKETKATKLDIGGSKISNLTPLSALPHLQFLAVANTQVSDLTPLSALSKLQSLAVHNTQVSDLTPLAALSKLQSLYFNNTQVSDLTPLAALPQLQILYVSDTQVSDLTPLSALTQLRYLSVSDTQVSDLTPLSALKQLQNLYVSNTQVSDLTPLSALIEKGIEVKWSYYGEGKGIYIKDTPLSNPPIEIAKQGNAAILRYWAELEKGSTFTLNESRLLVVGQGGAGKTTLRTKLIDPKATMPKPDATTRGIDINIMPYHTEGGDFFLNIWDFGGQNIQHYAHQFFLSDNVVYALVHSEREQNDHSSYWLNIIELLGKDSPILIVQNEKHGHSEDLKDMAAIRDRFPNVKKPIKLDLSKANDVDYKPFHTLRKEICHLASSLPHIGRTYAASYKAVQNAIAERATTDRFVSWDTYEALCRAQGMDNPETMRDYARSYHQLGVSLWFEDDIDLENYVFLRPKWIIDALFELLYDGDRRRKEAIIDTRIVKTIWHSADYRGMQGMLLKLMRNFEMCYPIQGDDERYLIPQNLPDRTTTITSSEQATRVLFRYKFLPKGFLTRLICRLHTKIATDQVWNNAVVFEENTTATVFTREVYDANTIELIAEGNGKANLLNEVIRELDKINQTSKFANLRVEKLVPCPCMTCKRLDEPHYFNYDYLQRKLLKGQTKAECDKSLDDVLIRDILREVLIFSKEQIENLIATDRIEDALKLLRGRFPEETEVIQQLSRLSGLERDQRLGKLEHNEYSLQKNRITEGVLQTLHTLA